MRRRNEKLDPDTFAEEIRARQNNIVWPGPLVNSRGVEAFFWKGSPNPTLVQRIAAWLFGVTHIGGAILLWILAWQLGGIAWLLLGTPAVAVGALGVKTFSNGFAKGKIRAKR